MFSVNFKDPATVYAYSLVFVHHQVVWFMILILAVVYWSFFSLVKDYNWFSFNKQGGSGFFLTYFLRYPVEIFFTKIITIITNKVGILPSFSIFYYRLLLIYNSFWVFSWIYYFDFMRWRIEYYPTTFLFFCNYAGVRLSLSYHTLIQGTFLFKTIDFAFEDWKTLEEIFESFSFGQEEEKLWDLLKEGVVISPATAEEEDSYWVKGWNLNFIFKEQYSSKAEEEEELLLDLIAKQEGASQDPFLLYLFDFITPHPFFPFVEEKLEQYVYSFFFNRSTSAYFFSTKDREEKDFLLAQTFRDNILLEYIWAIFPSLIIVLILIPSLYLLYSSEENLQPRFTFKVLAHQWFWSYELDYYAWHLGLAITKEGDKTIIPLETKLRWEFDSNLVPESDLSIGAKRLLEVDYRLRLPVNIPLRFLITSTDVLHSWAVPEMGIKVDAVPGRLNDTITLIRRPGVFYGQCSELCGVGHGFMPIVVEALSYNTWWDFMTQDRYEDIDAKELAPYEKPDFNLISIKPINEIESKTNFLDWIGIEYPLSKEKEEDSLNFPSENKKESETFVNYGFADALLAMRLDEEPKRAK